MKKFLTAFASIAAAFAAEAVPTKASPAIDSPVKNIRNDSMSGAATATQLISTIDSKGDEYEFILKRAEDSGYLMAYHSSHRSHSSHSSHRSHYSSQR